MLGCLVGWLVGWLAGLPTPNCPTLACLLAGILCLFCPHGICVAFTILTRHEGPRILFELIMSRFSVAPAMIVYDNVSHSAGAKCACVHC